MSMRSLLLVELLFWSNGTVVSRVARKSYVFQANEYTQGLLWAARLQGQTMAETCA